MVTDPKLTDVKIPVVVIEAILGSDEVQTPEEGLPK
jgi:hypothetical protein